MRELKIALASSRQAKLWANKTTSWDDLCARLKAPLRTAETAEEYLGMTKADRDEIKDIGGFVGGVLRDNLRRAENVACRSLLTMDADLAEVGFLDRFLRDFHHAACLYTTHSHTKESPRLRIVVPLKRDVSPDEYVALARFFAADWGIAMFDECSFIPNQLMYWPSCPSDGEFISRITAGEPLDPDEILAAHPSWQDCSRLPSSPREGALRDNAKKQQADPLAKSGVVGAFCRAYPVAAAIKAFLSDVYAPSAVDGRFDYIAGTAAAGVVIYDNKFAYSHHATDPACGRLLNAFDLVRIHKFGDEDEKKSFAAMAEFAVADERVKLLLTEERIADACREFDEGEDWKALLRYQARGNALENSVWNLSLILNNDPDFTGFAFNELANRVQITGQLPWERPQGNSFWRDADTAQLKALVDARYLPFSSRNHDVAFTKIADDRRFHPIRDYLNGLPAWDGVSRVETLFIDYLKADDTPYVRTVTRKSFAAMVARIYQPGIKFDSVPVLDGEQGIGKSTIIKDLVTAEYYSESLSLTDMDDKSGAEKLQGFWVVEIGELAGMKKADIEKVKAFLSTADDKYRPSYGKTVESHPRQCVIIATVNGERGYLRDITGNRRFWIIKLHQKKHKQKWSFDSHFREQFWAEAKAIYESGETLYLEGELQDAAEEAQRDAMELDERVGMVEDYLARLLPENWNAMDLYERREFLADTGSPLMPKGTVKRKTVSNAEIWCECFGKNFSELRTSDSYAIAALMTQLSEWERGTERILLPMYGRQRLYKKKDCGTS